jgi:anti-sigma-K factor RskA
MSPSVMNNERLVELLVQRATDGLNASERVELNRLLGQEQYSDSEQFEQTAAALLLAGCPEDEPLPEDLRERLLNQADAFGTQNVASPVADLGAIRAQRAQEISAAPARGGSKLAWFAVAASLLIALAGWWPRLTNEPATQQQVSTLEQRRDQLMAQAGSIRADWKGTEDAAAANVTGDVVWDPRAQTGYVRFHGLAANNPKQSQYQLWIFDKTRGDQYPVDGGVFDVPASGGDVIVPILAKLPISDAAMFAVTIERPGGVVVSDRGRLVLVAPVSAG